MEKNAKVLKFPQDAKDYRSLKNLIIHQFKLDEFEELEIDYNGAEIGINHFQDAYCRVELETYFSRYLFYIQKIISDDLGYENHDIAYSLRVKDPTTCEEDEKDLITRIICWDKSHDAIIDEIMGIIETDYLEIFDIDFCGNDDIQAAYNEIKNYNVEEVTKNDYVDEMILFLELRKLLETNKIGFMRIARQLSFGKDVTFSKWFYKWNDHLKLKNLKPNSAFKDLTEKDNTFINGMSLKLINNNEQI